MMEGNEIPSICTVVSISGMQTKSQVTAWKCAPDGV